MMQSCFTVTTEGEVQYDFGRLVDLLRKRTEMYTGGGSSLQNLRSFLAGVEYLFFDINKFAGENAQFNKALEIKRVGLGPDSDFSRWLRLKFNFGHNIAIGWDDIITALSLGFKSDSEVEDWNNLDQLASFEDHRKAVKLFFQLFDEYKVEQSASISNKKLNMPYT